MPALCAAIIPEQFDIRHADDSSAEASGSAQAGRPISVLLCVCNGAEFLRGCIDSVLGQTWTDFELVVVDDGSTDDTPGILADYCARDSRLRVITKANTGLVNSLNVGLTECLGEWIARIDVDDVCEPDRLKAQLAYVRANPDVGLLGSAFLEIGEDGAPLRVLKLPAEHDRLVRSLERMQASFPHSTAFFNRRLALSLLGYREAFRRSQDWDMWLRLSSVSRIACLEEPLTRIRRHPGSISLVSVGNAPIVFAIAASTCHFIRKDRQVEDPSRSSGAAWQEFLAWVDQEVTRNRVVERRDVWNRARGRFLASNSLLPGALRAIATLGRGKQLGTIAYEKAFGSSLPRKLAGKWSRRDA